MNQQMDEGVFLPNRRFDGVHEAETDMIMHLVTSCSDAGSFSDETSRCDSRKEEAKKRSEGRGLQAASFQPANYRSYLLHSSD